MTLRYSATHRNSYNLVYRLDPIRAFELKLVKQIVVASASADGASPDAYVRVEDIRLDKGLSAKIRIQVQAPGGPKPKSFAVKAGTDLHTLSNERAEYAGYSIAEINAEPGREYVRFANGHRLPKGGELGGVREDVWRAQIKHTVKRHLETGADARRARDQSALPLLHRSGGELPELRRTRAADSRQVR